MARRPGARGATLAELVVVLAIITLLGGLVLPPLRRSADRAAVASAATEVVALFALARHAALVRSAYVTVRIQASDSSMLVQAADDTLELRRLGRSSGVSLQATRPEMRYAPNGLGYGAANGRVIVRRGRAADTVLVSRLGRVRR